MAVCCKCGKKAIYLLFKGWFCDECMRKVLDKPVPPVPRKKVKVSCIDETGRLLRAPLCDVCQNKMAVFIVGGTGVCRDCSFADKPSEDQIPCEDSSQKRERIYKGKSVIDFPNEYVCVDVETTGRSLEEDEIIEVAALHVKDGRVLDRFVSFVRPLSQHIPMPYEEIRELGYTSVFDVPYDVFSEFSKRKMVPAHIRKLTKITDDMLFDAPTPDKVMPQFHEFVGNHILVAHNADFDVNFLYDTCQCYGLALRNDYVDTLRISRNLLSELEHHRLEDLAVRFGIVQNSAHRAEADVITTIECFEKMRGLALRDKTVAEYARDFVEPDRRSSSRTSRASRTAKGDYAQKHFRPSELVAPDSVDTSHPLYGKSVVFTGDLSIERIDAAQMAADVGALVKTAVSGKTDFLVIGQQDIVLVGSSGISSKEKKAQELNASGKGHIRILSEQEFIDLVGTRKEASAL